MPKYNVGELIAERPTRSPRRTRRNTMKHKPKKLRCPTCLIGGYTQSQCLPVDGRPLFTCTRCDASWTCGKDGGEYALGETQ